MFVCFSFKVSPITFFTVYWAIKTKHYTAWNCETQVAVNIAICVTWLFCTQYPQSSIEGPINNIPAWVRPICTSCLWGGGVVTGDVRHAGSNSTSSCLLLQLLSHEGWRQVNGQCQRLFFGVFDNNGGVVDIWLDIVFLFGDELRKRWRRDDLVRVDVKPMDPVDRAV